MPGGFEKIVEERIKTALRKGEFDNLKGSGKPIAFEDDTFVPEDLRLAYKILKNADFIPPELELRKEIKKTEDLLAGMEETQDKYNILKKLNFLIMKLNAISGGRVEFEVPQKYEARFVNKMERGRK